MPHLVIRTNSDIAEAAQQALIREASSLIAATLGKAEDYVMITLQCRQTMLFGGSDAPLAYLQLESIGLNKPLSELAKTLCDFIHSHLAIPTDRIYVRFDDISRDEYAWNGRTFG